MQQISAKENFSEYTEACVSRSSFPTSTYSYTLSESCTAPHDCLRDSSVCQSSSDGIKSADSLCQSQAGHGLDGSHNRQPHRHRHRQHQHTENAVENAPGNYHSPSTTKIFRRPDRKASEAHDTRAAIFKRLDDLAATATEVRPHCIGYPVNENTDLREFYEWYMASGLYRSSLNNVGDPRHESVYALNTHTCENEVIDFFAPYFGFEQGAHWGFVTSSGTDGNQHGMYFGARYLLSKMPQRPVVYVSEEAHYSVKKLADVHNLELRLIPVDIMGHMDVRELERVLDPLRPALLVIAIGTTFKGACDDQKRIDAVLKRKRPVAVYRHLDAALFGGFLPFSDSADVLNRSMVQFDSIAVSGHKFFGFDEPCGFFITSREVLDHLNPFHVEYLHDAVPTISCSRNSLTVLKFWWKIKNRGREYFQRQARTLLGNARYLKHRLNEMGYPAWINPHSNIVFMRRPGPAVMTKYGLAMEVDARLGGDLAHVIVMQHVTKALLDVFLKDLTADISFSGDKNAIAATHADQRDHGTQDSGTATRDSPNESGSG